MKSIFGVAAIAGVAALVVPQFIQDRSSVQEEASHSSSAKKVRTGPASVKIFKNTYGHFSDYARINGKRIEFLVDTGASSVAINRSTAEHIGLRYGNRGTTRVSTANGNLTADNAVIKKISIGDITVHNVSALVLPDSSLNETLLGMSFLKKLKRFEMSGRTLTMVK